MDYNKKKSVHKCSTCGKLFRTKRRLNDHQMIHTGEKPYCCEICRNSFAGQDYFKIHVSMHAGEIGEKPFYCDLCDRSFSHRDGIKKHMMIHIGDKEPESVENYF